MIYSGDNEKALSGAEEAAEDFHLSTAFKFFKGVLLKMMGRKKEANQLLRYCPFENTYSLMIN